MFEFCEFFCFEVVFCLILVYFVVVFVYGVTVDFLCVDDVFAVCVFRLPEFK